MATPDEAVLDLPDDLSSVALARRFVREKLSEWGIESSLDDAMLVVSELASNALRHAESSYRVRLAAAGPALRIEVSDDGVGMVEPRPLTDSDEHGRGLHLVSALAASWGTEASGTGGKLVWAELPIGAAGHAVESPGGSHDP
jgi:anti-sigma regulatory factor (Ser/Thr protein kinase)